MKMFIDCIICCLATYLLATGVAPIVSCIIAILSMAHMLMDFDIEES